MTDEKTGTTDGAARVAHVEHTLHRLLSAQGEVYVGATDDKDQLAANIQAVTDDARDLQPVDAAPPV